MAYCIHCGSKLKDGACFCIQCGAEVTVDDGEESVDIEEGDEPEIEDCDEEPEKGPPSDCYATFMGRCVTVYRENGSVYKRIYLNREVLGVQVMGDRMSITCEDGWCYVYTLDGILVRQMRH